MRGRRANDAKCLRERTLGPIIDRDKSAPNIDMLTLTRFGSGHKVPPPLFLIVPLQIHFFVLPGAAAWLSPGRTPRKPRAPRAYRSSTLSPSTRRSPRRFTRPSIGSSASQAFILGDQVAQFEEKAAAYCDARDAIGCASGTDALILALMALDIGPGDEVITSAFTFFATASAIHRVGRGPSSPTSIRSA